MSVRNDLTESQRQLLAQARQQRDSQQPSEKLYEDVLQAVQASSQPATSTVASAASAEPYLSPERPRIGARKNPSRRRDYWPLAAVAAVALLVGLNFFASPSSTSVTALSSRNGLENHPLFRSMAVMALPTIDEGAAGDLFKTPPFARPSAYWQVRHWDNLKADPVGEVDYEFLDNALCLTLQRGQRVFGGWPWQAEVGKPAKVLASNELAGDALASDAFPTVALRQGQAYELNFDAWSTAPKETRFLVAIGHASPPYSANAGARVQWTAEARRYSISFVSQFDDPAAGIAFIARMTGEAEQAQVCLRNLRLHER